MNMAERQLWAQYAHRQTKADAALAHFERHPDFVLVHVQVLDALNALQLRINAERLNSNERFQLVAEAFEAKASGYLRLVTDLDSQKLYCGLLEACAFKAVEDLTGLSSAHVLFSGNTQAEHLIAERAAYWNRESFRKLIPKSPAELEPDHPTCSDSGLDREELLEDYKKATGNPSNRSIYESRNSGIHKPQFYEWLNGNLPATSETAKNFERFLREKKAPVPRRPKG